MARDLSTFETTSLESGCVAKHQAILPAGNPDLPAGGRVTEFHFPATDKEPEQKVLFIEQEGKATVRRTSQMWFTA